MNIQLLDTNHFPGFPGFRRKTDKNQNKTNLHAVSDYIFDIYLRVLVGVYALLGEEMNIG